MAQDNLSLHVESAPTGANESTHNEPTQKKSSSVSRTSASISHHDAQSEKTQTASDAADSAPQRDASPAEHESLLTHAIRWFDIMFPRNRHAVIGGCVGLIVALMIFIIGIIDTLIIAVFIIAGIAIGQYFDGDAKLGRFLQDVLKRR